MQTHLQGSGSTGAMQALKKSEKGELFFLTKQLWSQDFAPTFTPVEYLAMYGDIFGRGNFGLEEKREVNVGYLKGFEGFWLLCFGK